MEAKRAFRWLATAAFVLSMVSVGVSWQIEGTIWRHPLGPTAEYPVPLEVKGIVRYVTPDQKLYDTLAQYGFFLGIVLAAIGAAGSEGYFNRQRRK